MQTMEESLQILSFYEQLGVSEVWLTPHIMEDIPNTTEGLKERFAKLNAAYQGNITLLLAAENMLDNLFEERQAMLVWLFVNACLTVCTAIVMGWR